MPERRRPRESPNIVFPTPMSGGLVLLLLAIAYAGLSQGNNAAYLLGFVIIGIAATGVAHTWHNLRRLRIEIQSVPSVFAGDQVKLPFEVLNPARLPSFDIRVSTPGARSIAKAGKIAASSAWRDSVSFQAERRGYHPVCNVSLASNFPVSFFEARRWVKVSQKVMVYPKPAGDPRLPLPAGGSTSVSTEGIKPEGDDFAGVRAYQLGESQRHVDWKAVARGAPLLIKQFSGTTGGTVRFDWAALTHLSVEDRLSQLALWIVKAEAGGVAYALHLPGTQTPAGRGEAHFHHCLRELALFEGDLK